MKRFIVATIIFVSIALTGIIIDALFLHSVWQAMPNLVYYALGWLAAGIYVLIATRGDKK